MRIIGRRDFIEASVLSGTWAVLQGHVPDPVSSPPSGPFELEEATLAVLQEGMKTGRWTAESLTETYRQRITDLDRAGPRVNSVIELNPEAPAEARALDAERREKGPRSPLHGIPVLIKDNIDTTGPMATTAGSLALTGVPPAARDAGVVKRLREAGAVLLGKTNLSEWANFRSSRSVSGWSGRGGQTRNPYALDRNPCGSSSGSGAAVSANFAALAVGTETDGSIVCPSSINGVVGIKPTVGLVSRSGIIPISHTQDTAGPMARTVTDAAILLGVLAGHDPRDPATAVLAGRQAEDYTRYLDAGGLRGARLGVVRSLFGFNGKVDRLLAASITALKDAGAVLVDPVEIPGLRQLDDPEFEVLLYEFKTGLNAYLATRPGIPCRTLKELIAYNEVNREREMPVFGQEVFIQAEKKGPLSSPEYRKALARCRRLSRDKGIDAVMNRHRLDALVAPTGGIPWLTDPLNGDHFTGGCSTPAAVAGYPHITVPAGLIAGLPVGLSFFGRAFSEPVLIRLAFAFEQATKYRRPPGFQPSARI